MEEVLTPGKTWHELRWRSLVAALCYVPQEAMKIKYVYKNTLLLIYIEMAEVNYLKTEIKEKQTMI